MYSLSAFFILSSRAPPNTSAAAFITPPRTGDNDQPEEDIIKTLNHKKYMVEDNRSFIMNEGSPSGFLSWPWLRTEVEAEGNPGSFRPWCQTLK